MKTFTEYLNEAWDDEAHAKLIKAHKGYAAHQATIDKHKAEYKKYQFTDRKKAESHRKRISKAALAQGEIIRKRHGL